MYRLDCPSLKTPGLKTAHDDTRSWTHQGVFALNMCVLNGRKIQLLTIGFPLRPQIKPSFLSGVKNVGALGV